MVASAPEFDIQAVLTNINGPKHASNLAQLHRSDLGLSIEPGFHVLGVTPFEYVEMRTRKSSAKKFQLHFS